MVNDDVENSLIELSTKPNAKERVFSYLVRNMANGNKIVMKQSVVSKELGITRQYISRVLKSLELMRYIVKTGKDQNNNVYMINPGLHWKGDGDYHVKAIESFTKMSMKRVPEK